MTKAELRWCQNKKQSGQQSVNCQPLVVFSETLKPTVCPEVDLVVLHHVQESYASSTLVSIGAEKRGGGNKH